MKSQDLGSKYISNMDFVAKLHNFASEFQWHLRKPPSTNVNSLRYFESVLNYKLHFVYWALSIL